MVLSESLKHLQYANLSAINSLYLKDVRDSSEQNGISHKIRHRRHHHNRIEAFTTDVKDGYIDHSTTSPLADVSPTVYNPNWRSKPQDLNIKQVYSQNQQKCWKIIIAVLLCFVIFTL